MCVRWIETISSYSVVDVHEEKKKKNRKLSSMIAVFVGVKKYSFTYVFMSHSFKVIEQAICGMISYNYKKVIQKGGFIF